MRLRVQERTFLERSVTQRTTDGQTEELLGLHTLGRTGVVVEKTIRESPARNPCSFVFFASVREKLNRFDMFLPWSLRSKVVFGVRDH